MSENLFLGDTNYPHTPRAETYLRGKYGAYRGHTEWRALEDSFNAGFNDGLIVANNQSTSRIENLERELAEHKKGSDEAIAYQQTLNKMQSEKDEINKQWYLACKEIISRCVSPNMYGNAIELLEMAYLQSVKDKK